MRVGVLVVVLALLVGCGKKLGPGKTPKETIRNFAAAIKDLDMGAVYDMLSQRSRRQLDAVFNQTKQAFAMVPAAQLERFGMADFADMSTREILTSMVDKMRDAAPDQIDQLKSMHVIVMDVKKHGNTAQVEVRTLFNEQTTTQKVPMVKEGGLWYLDSDESVTGLPVSLTPNLAACVGSP